MNNLSNKNIFFGLVGIFCLMFLLVYTFVINPMLAQKKQVTYLKSQMGNTNIEQQIKENNKQIKNYKQQFSIFENTEEHNKKISSLLLRFSQSKDFKIESFEKLKMQELQKFQIANNEIILSGDFKEILKCLYELEYVEKLGAIASCNFYMNKVNKQQRLFANIHLQNINFKTNSF